MPANKLAEKCAPNGVCLTKYSVTWDDNLTTEKLPWLPQLNITLQSRPRDMNDLILWPFAFMYLEYDCNGRRLQREAVHSIMGMVFKGERDEARHKTYNKLDNVNDSVVIAVKRLAVQFGDEWKPCIDDWYQEAYNRYPSFKARHDYLPRLLGRLPKVTLEKPCNVGGTRELWELCIVYVVVNLSRTRRGEAFSKDRQKEIIGYWWNVNPDRTEVIITKLANPAEKDTKKIESVVFDFAEVLMAGANMVVNEFEKENLGLLPREGPALAATTASLEGISLGATAPGPSHAIAPTAPTSSQPPGPDASQLTVPAPGTPDPFEEFTNQSTYSQSPTSPTPAGGGVGTDPRDKGKGRARENTSSSPGGDKSGKGKGKRPRRESFSMR